MFKDGLENDGSKASYWDSQQWTTAQNSQPDIVTIMLGTNDSKIINWGDASRSEVYFNDYVDMINILSQLPSQPKIYAMIPPELFSPYPYNMQSDVINKTLPVLIRQIASLENVEVIDNWSLFGGVDMTIDGCHPNDAGHNLIA